MSMDDSDTFGSMYDRLRIPSSQELSPSCRAVSEDSQESDAPGGLHFQPTGLCTPSRPSTAEANGGTPSEEKFETPPEEAVPAASSEERWFGCEGESVVVGAEEKTVDLGRDTDLGFSETEMVQKTMAESGSGVARAGEGKNIDEEWAAFQNWKQKMAFRERLVEELRQKRSKLDSAASGFYLVEEKSEENTAMSMMDLQSGESLPMKDQLSMKSNECAKSASFNSEVDCTVPNAGMTENGLESNECTQVVRSVSGGKCSVSEVGVAKNCPGSSECAEAVNLGSGGKSLIANAGVCKTGLDPGCSEVSGLGLRGKGMVVDAGIDENNVESNDHTAVVWLDSGEDGLVSDQCIAKNDLDSNCFTQVVNLDTEDNERVLDESGSTEEIVADSDDQGQVTNEATAKHVEGEGLLSGAGDVKRKPTLKVKHARKRLNKVKGMGGLRNKKGIEKAKVVEPSGSKSNQTPNSARKLPSPLPAPEKEGSAKEDKNPSLALLSYCLGKLPKTQLDPIYENLSLMEIAKRRGITFPRPRWWVEEDEE